ncbi:hypothetical protein Vretifemale_8448 [Volvox reticuliferus]|uniref:Uncharacterized protein n=1 Tax=Volvox reticuliferus TaxID=1737510 RepID=A0A8J4CDT9_9CHLO|nr:hypothetical protein Vretifemale_8448 [Volvox reticuliferus]
MITDPPQMPLPVIAATLQDPLAQTGSSAPGASPLHIYATVHDNGSSGCEQETETLKLSRNAHMATAPSDRAPKVSSQTVAMGEVAPKPSSTGQSGVECLNYSSSRILSGPSESAYQKSGTVTSQSRTADAILATGTDASASHTSAASATAVALSGTALLSLQECCCKASEVRDPGSGTGDGT